MSNELVATCEAYMLNRSSWLLRNERASGTRRERNSLPVNERGFTKGAILAMILEIAKDGPIA
eukprot:scaffold2818_cov133-Skeletonema_marinoi.AAC.19